MIIIIKLMDGTTHSIEVEYSYSINAIKAIIEEKLNIKKTTQRLIYHGYPLLDDSTLETCGINNNSIIYLVLQLGIN
jgi:hypothetical protein